jgi:antitoxin CcdA
MRMYDATISCVEDTMPQSIAKRVASADTRRAKRRAVNISLPVDLIADVKARGIPLSATFEAALRAELARLNAESWERENATAIAASNQQLRDDGLWSDGMRRF